MQLLRIENISKSYKNGFLNNPVKVLENISFSVSQGKNLALVGKSGCGKTTIAKIITGLIKPDAGQINFASDNGNRMVQMLFQNYSASLNPRMSVRDILREPFRLSGFSNEQADSKINEILAHLDINASWLDKYSHQLSGGQKQRVAILRAIAPKPRIIILDEPFSSQDFVARKEILDLLRKIQSEFDITYILISHDTKLIKNFCQEVLYLESAARETRTPTPFNQD